MRWAPGSTAVLSAQFETIEGDPVDPVGLVVDITDSFAAVRVNDGVPARLAQGIYEFSYVVPQDAPLGMWRIDWIGTVGGLQVIGEEDFEIVAAGTVVVVGGVSDLAQRLRRRLAEVSELPPENEGSDTMFSDEEIRNLLAYADNDIDKATLEGWLVKEAYYASMIDISEHGSDRKLSQLWKHAQGMVAHYAEVTHSPGSVSNGGRMVGRSMNLRNDSEELETPFSGYSDHIRVYAGKRFMVPAVM